MFILKKVFLLLISLFYRKQDLINDVDSKHESKVKQTNKSKITLNIIVYVDLYDDYRSIKRFVFDGWVVPNIGSPYYACNYLRQWMRARKVGDGYAFEATNFLEACLVTKTSSSIEYCDYEIVVKIANEDQTLTKLD